MYLNITKKMIVDSYTQDFWKLAAMRYDPKVLERKDAIYLTESNLQEFCDLVSPQKDFIGYLFQIADDGGSFGDVKLFVKLENHLLDRPVPEGFNDRTDDDGIVLDWRKWGCTPTYDPFMPCKEQRATVCVPSTHREGSAPLMKSLPSAIIAKMNPVQHCSVLK